MAGGWRDLTSAPSPPARPLVSTAAPWHPSLPLSPSQTLQKRDLTRVAEEDTEPSERHGRGCPGSEDEQNVLPQPRKAPDSGLPGCGEECRQTPADPVLGAGPQPLSRERPAGSRASSLPPPLLSPKVSSSIPPVQRCTFLTQIRLILQLELERLCFPG